MRALVRWLSQDPRPDGLALRLARWWWLVLAAGGAVLLAASLGLMWRDATTVGPVTWFGGPGHYHLSSAQLRALSDLGLSAEWHGALVVSRMLVLFTGSVFVGWLVWRTRRGWAAVFVSWFLISGLGVTAGEIFEEDTLIVGIAALVMGISFFISLVGMLFVLPDGRNIRWLALAIAGWFILLGTGFVFVGDDALWESGALGVLVVVAAGWLVQLVQLVRTNDPTRRAVLGLTAVMAAIFVPVLMFSDQLAALSESQARAGGELVRRILVESLVAALPLIFGLGLVYLIVKRGLWDLDLAINRTVVYFTLTSVLFAAYFALVAMFQAISSESFGIRDNTLALVLATGAAAALFLPLRERLQRVVDRVFFRQRWDLERSLDDFDERLATRSRIDSVGPDLIAAAEGAFQPATIELWLPVSRGEAET